MLSTLRQTFYNRSASESLGKPCNKYDSPVLLQIVKKSEVGGGGALPKLIIMIAVEPEWGIAV